MTTIMSAPGRLWGPGPWRLDAPGLYWLDEHKSMALAGGYAVHVNSHDVQFDTRGYAMLNSAGAGNLATAIYAYGRHRIRVRGRGSIAGFCIGVNLEYGCDYAEVDELSVSAWARAFDLNGLACAVRGVTVPYAGGSTTEWGYGIGVSVEGRAGLIEDCRIRNCYPKTAADEGCAISAGHDAQGTTIRRNLILFDELRPDTFGIWGGGDAGTPGRIFIEDNRILRADRAAACSSGAAGFLARNVAWGCTPGQEWQVGPGGYLAPDNMVQAA